MSNIKDVRDWSIVISGFDRPPLYFVERPSFKFPMEEERRGGKTILKSSKKPVWQPITLDLPVISSKVINSWFESKRKCNVFLQCVNVDGRIIEEWGIQNAELVNIKNARGRNVDLEVLRIKLKYSWAFRRQ